DKDGAKKFVSVGDFATFDSEFFTFGKDGKTLKGKALDDRMGCALLIELMRKIREEKPLLDQIEALFEVYRTKTDEAERTALYRQIDSLSYEASKLSIPNEYDKLMAAIGAEGTNAYTSFDVTCYVEDIPSNQLENWAKIQADRFKHNVIRGFHTELETVYEEKNMSLTNDSRKLVEAMFNALFAKHPYGTQTVLGTQEHLKNPSITNIKDYYKKWYVPNNMAICMSGDFDYDEVMDVIEKYFGDMQPNKDLQMMSFESEAPITSPIVKEVWGLEAENVALAWRLPGAASDEALMLSVADAILNNGKAGLIDLNLLQTQKVLWASSFPYDQADYTSYFMQGAPKQGQSLDEVKELLLAQVDLLRKGEWDESLLTAGIANYKLQVQSMLEDNESRADLFVQSFVNVLKWEDMVKRVERMEKITKADVVAFANEYLKDNNYAVVYKRQGQDPNVKKIAKPTITPIFTNRDTTSAFLREVQASVVTPIEPVFVDFEKEMSKGTVGKLPFLYKKNDLNDIFHLLYIFDFGAFEMKELATASDYLQYLGTSDMTPADIKLAFYNLACNYSVSVSDRQVAISLSGLSNTSVTLSTEESFLAHLAAATAVCPPPITTTLPMMVSSASSGLRLKFSRNSKAEIFLPNANLRCFCFPAPMARTIFSNPCSRSSLREVTSTPSSISIPKA
ncbi:MAG: insulinase family protein, partial [Oscillospiraceae bacterium]|nr:insulinase family protein [Oscillospiraceae bacterium]